jgi:hypothetical protein
LSVSTDLRRILESVRMIIHENIFRITLQIEFLLQN